jgi:hypothetical protein
MSTDTIPELRESLLDQAAWIRRLLQTMQTRTSGNPHNEGWNSWAVAEVPEWELRQKLQSLEESIAATQE